MTAPVGSFDSTPRSSLSEGLNGTALGASLASAGADPLWVEGRPGFLGRIYAASLRRNLDGQTVYYPWGALGMGRVMTDKTQEQRLLRFLKYTYLLSFGLLAIAIILGWFYFDLAVAVYFVWFFAMNRALTVGCPAVRRPKFREFYGRVAGMHSARSLWALTIGVVLFAAFCAWAGIIARSRSERVVAALGFGCFVVITITGVYTIYLKHSMPQENY